jgi:ribose 5-phosphate isomerase B
MKIAIGSDHAGYVYKERIKSFLAAAGHEVVDCSPYPPRADDDYPTMVRPAAAAVAQGQCQRAIVLGGSGNGEAIVANRLPGVRCAVCWNVESARLGRAHNDANVLSLGQRMMDEQTALAIVQTWLETPFEGGRHARRIALIDQPQPPE